MTKRLLKGSKSSLHSDKCWSDHFSSDQTGSLQTRPGRAIRRGSTSVLKHPPCIFSLKGRWLYAIKLEQLKILSFHWLKSPPQVSLNPLQQVTGGVLPECALGTQITPVLVSLPRGPCTFLCACSTGSSRDLGNLRYSKTRQGTAWLTALAAGNLASVPKLCSERWILGCWRAVTIPSPSPVWGCFWGRHPQSSCQGSGSSLRSCWEGGISLSHTATAVVQQWAPHCSLSPKVNKHHPALLLFVLLQPPALLPCSNKEQLGQREAKHVFCLLLNNRGFCNTLICEAANTRKGQNSVKPL